MTLAASRPRLLVISDDPLSASALRSGMRGAQCFQVVEGYVDGRMIATDAVDEHAPAVVIVDHLRDAERMIDRTGEARRAMAHGKVVALPTVMSQALISALARAGADAAIQKTRPLGRLPSLIGDVVAGRIFHAFAPQEVNAREPHALAHALTERELEILRLAALGAPNGRIAAQLWITEQTVKFHLSNVFRKLGVANRTEASLHAYTHGLLEDRHGTGVAA